MLRSLLLSLVLAPTLSAQVGAGHAVVVSRGAGAMTLLVEVDLETGSVQALGGFASDQFAPLAVAIDPINLDLVVALDLGSSTRFLRLGLSGTAVVAETVLADVAGSATHVTIGAAGDVFAAFGGMAGKLIRLPRHGGAPLAVLPMPHASAMTDFGLVTGSAVVVQSDEAGSDPQVSWVELNEVEIIQGPDLVTGLSPSPVTGVFDYPTGVARQLLSRADGTIALHLPGSGLPPEVLQIDPAIPPGGAVAMRGTLDLRPIVLGGAADPFLKTFDLFAAIPQWQVLSGPLPGDPVDYAVAPEDLGAVQSFGVACGDPGLLLFGDAGGAPALGNPQFRLQLLGGVPSSPALLALGFDDPPPVLLPSGCELLVSPDHVLLFGTDAFGAAELPLPIPNHVSLVDLFFYAQWFQAPGSPFSTSEAASIRIGH